MRSGLSQHDLLHVAEDLANANRKKPKQAHLLRAVSTIYYAMFHALARCCADMMVGTASAERSKPAWQQVYRALEHGAAKNACKDKMRIAKFPIAVQDFADTFIALQTKRHKADYDPQEKTYKSAVLSDIRQAKAVIDGFENAPVKDRRAFAVLVLFKPPRQP